MKCILAVMLLFCSQILNSQSLELADFDQVEIDPTSNGNIGIAHYDVDNDGDKDIISVSRDEGELNWFRNNLDSTTGSFSFQKFLIASNINGLYLDVEDVNNDGIPEILCSVPSEGEIVLFHGSSIADSIYWNKETVINDFNGAHQVHLIDMDNDGDLDILAAANIDNKIKWWEYKAGNWISHLIDGNYQDVQSVVCYDFNDDGYQDIVSGNMSQTIGFVNIWYSSYSDSLIFIKDTLETNLYGSHWFDIEDINKDGLKDIIVASYFSNKIVAWERRHADSLSFVMKTIVPNIAFPLHIEAVDMDNDGDIDLLVPELSGNNHKLLCYENIDGTYSRKIIKSYFNAAWQMIPLDVDNDHDMDFVAGGFYFPNPGISAELSVFVNTLLTTGISLKMRESSEGFCYNYPNPFSLHTTIIFSINEESDVILEIYNQSGRLLLSQSKGLLGKGNHSFRWNGNDGSGNRVKDGLYIYKIISGNSVFIRKMLVNH